MRKIFILIAFFCVSQLFSPPPAEAKVTLASVFGEGMVLQRNKSIPIWGKASAGESITLRLKKQVVQTKADGKGNFRIDFSPEPAGGPYSLTVDSPQKEVIPNVYIGEVWICAGQSNMLMTVEETIDADRFLSGINQNLHLLQVPAKPSAKPEREFSAKWQIASAPTARNFSAIGFGFGSKIANDLKIPVGIICSAVGGTNLDAWTPGLKSEPACENDRASDNSRCFNGMLSPLIPYAIQGIVWYQGEADLGKQKAYEKKFPSWIEAMRDVWKQEDYDFPVIFVQLPRSNYMQSTFGDVFWADFRLAQQSATELRNVFMVTSIDIGEAGDIHPKSKFALAERIAITALARCYSRKLVYSGPSVKKMEIVDGDKIKITFDCNVADLRIRGDGGFRISSFNGKFVTAKVSTRDDSLIISSTAIPKPVRLQYAYANVPTGLIVSKDGFPLAPFNYEFLEQLDTLH